MNPATVSVVLPLYNHERYIVEALESVFLQSFPAREVIVVDDGSMDGSVEMVKSHFGDRPELVFWTKPNAGAHHTINAGVCRATSDYVAILNTDDLFNPDRLRICVELLERDYAAQMACTGLSFVDDAGSEIDNPWYVEALSYYQKSENLPISLINGNFIMTTSNFVLRRSVFEAFGYFEPYRYVHDLSFLLNLLARGAKIVVDERPMLKYRLHQSNTIAEGVLKVKAELALVIADYIQKISRISPSILFSRDSVHELYEVLDQHNLSRMIFPLLAYLNSPSGAGGIGSVLSSELFQVVAEEAR